MPEIQIFNPDTLGKPLGQYSQITRVRASEFLFIAGQVATDQSGQSVGIRDFDAQCVQTFANIEAALKACGATFANVVEFTTYLTSPDDIPAFMKFRQERRAEAGRRQNGRPQQERRHADHESRSIERMRQNAYEP